MKSRVHVNSHPVHPMLVTMPIGLWTGSLAYDLAAAGRGSMRLRDSANDMMLAGLVGALAAAVPGAIDYFAIVPPESSAKSRAATHGLLNLGLAALYGTNWLLRTRSPHRWGRWLGLPLSALGWGTMLYSGWLGGTLVYRNQIGVDHRYAGAGRWRETEVEPHPGEPLTVARSDELGIDQMKLVHFGDKRIVLGRTAQGYVAFDDHCTHKGGSLADGVLICGTVECPWHGSQFDVCTGAVRSGPAKEGIPTYQVEERGGEVQIIL